MSPDPLLERQANVLVISPAHNVSNLLAEILQDDAQKVSRRTADKWSPAQLQKSMQDPYTSA